MTASLIRSAAILVPWLIWLAYWIHASSGAKQTVCRESRWSRTLQSMPLIVGCALIIWPAQSGGGGAGQSSVFGPLQWLGLATVIGGLAFSVWGRLHLGTNWSASVTLKHAHELIRTGPYALVRHPIYAGCLLAIAGSALLQERWAGVVGFALIFGSLAYKVRVEERWLSGHFGEPYQAYRRVVRALVPGIY
jgi:protein-S-isoprenylcysteine O-methyltransferase Ste14